MQDSHGGNVWRVAEQHGLDPESIIDFSASINPLGPPDELQPVLSQAETLITKYPEPWSETFCAHLAKSHGVSPEAVIAGNGSCELLRLAGAALQPRRVLIPVPSFSEYEFLAQRCGAEICFHATREERGFAIAIDELVAAIPHVDLLILGHPNSPTGSLLSRQDLESIISACEDADTRLLLDAVFLEMVVADEVANLARRAAASANILLLGSFTKLHAIPGLRLGYLVGRPRVIHRLRACQPPWSVNTLAQAAGLALINAASHAMKSREFVRTERQRLFRRLTDLPMISPFPGSANFLLAKLQMSGMTSTQLCHALAPQGLLLRDCAYVRGLGPRFVRIAVRRPDENDRLLAALQNILKDAA